MLTVLYSNSYDVLEHALLEQLGAPVDATVWQCDDGDTVGRGWVNWAESVVVPHRGCRQRLEQAMALRYGICANIDFPFLTSWLWTQMAGVVKGLSAEVSPMFSLENRIWAIYRFLEPGALEADLEVNTNTETNAEGKLAASVARLQAYIASTDERARYTLACRIARLFDHYLTDRSEWLSAWQMKQTVPALLSHPDADWQAVLWRKLIAVFGQESALSVQVQHFLKQVRAANFVPPLSAWPARASIFILSDIAPLHLTLLGELARWIDIRLYVLNPCKGYWHDLVRQTNEVQVEAGHPLLAQWGRYTQRYLCKLEDLTQAMAATDASFYMEHTEPTWLAAIKNAILDLQPYPPFSRTHASPDHPDAYSQQDTADTVPGIEVHSCHSLVRQLEVLHNRLLAQFAEDASLQPADVLVVVPDMASATPLIDAVFGTAQGNRYIPYRHIGASSFSTNPVAQVFIQLLRMAEQETTLSDLIAWFDVDAFAARYGIEASQIATLEHWLHAAGVIRGLGDPTLASNTARRGVTFSDALMRLALGYALPQDAPPVQGWLPVTGAEKGFGSRSRAHFSRHAGESVQTEPELLGDLMALCDALNHFAKAIAIAHTPLEWRVLLLEAVERFFIAHTAESSDAAHLITLRHALYDLTQAMAQGAPDTPVGVAVLREALQAQLDAKARTEPAGGGVMFSDRTSHSHLPYRVIALMGMDAGVWPSIACADEFDLIAAFPRKEDRHMREEERALFLAYLLAAQDLFWVAYTGRSLRDDSALPPAAPVETLLDYLSRLACGEQASPAELALARQRFVTLHPLHPFSAAYFAESWQEKEPGGEERLNTSEASGAYTRALYTYDAQHADIATMLGQPLSGKKPLPFFSAGSIGAYSASHTVSESAQALHFDQILRFWSHPIRALLQDQWEIVFPFSRLRLDDNAQPDSESVVADWRAREILAEKIVPVLLKTSRAAGFDQADEAKMALYEEARAIAQACPGWPNGVLGDLACQKECALLQAFADRVLRAQSGEGVLPRQTAQEEQAPFMPTSYSAPKVLNFALQLQTDALPPVLIDFLKDFLSDDSAVSLSFPEILGAVNSVIALNGVLDPITPHGLVLYRYANVTARDYLSAWLQHLVLCVVAPEGVQRRTVWLGKTPGEDFCLNPVEAASASAHLVAFLVLYQVGGMKPLPFFPKSALAEVTQGGHAAMQVWQGNGRIPGESADPYLRLGLRAQEEGASSESFTTLAHALFTPLLEALSHKIHTANDEADPCKS